MPRHGGVVCEISNSCVQDYNHGMPHVGSMPGTANCHQGRGGLPARLLETSVGVVTGTTGSCGCNCSGTGFQYCSAYARTPYEPIPYDVSYGVSHTGSLIAFTDFNRVSKSSINLH